MRCSLADTAEAHAPAEIGPGVKLACHREPTSNGMATWGITDEDRARWAEAEAT